MNLKRKRLIIAVSVLLVIAITVVVTITQSRMQWHAIFMIQATASSVIWSGLPERWSSNKARE